MPTPTPSQPFRAQDIEIAAEVQLTKTGQPTFVADVTQDNRLLLTVECGVGILDVEGAAFSKVAEGGIRSSSETMFSADERSIAYAASRNCDELERIGNWGWPGVALWVLDLDSREKKTLYDGFAPVLKAWLPDGRFLVERLSPDGGPPRLWLETADGEQSKVPESIYYPSPPITAGGLGPIVVPDAISPDGAKLYSVAQGFKTERISEGRSRMTWQRDSKVTDLITGESWKLPLTYGGAVAWSQDSRLIGYMSLLTTMAEPGQATTLVQPLLVFDTETARLSTVLRDTQSNNVRNPLAWSPDSNVLLLQGLSMDSLFAVNVDGSGLTQVYPTPVDTARPPVFTSTKLTAEGWDGRITPMGDFITNMHWSPDGGYLFYGRMASSWPVGSGTPEAQRAKQQATFALWAAVVRKPGETDAQLQERVRQLEDGPWPLSVAP